jgi:hypothetical protein
MEEEKTIPTIMILAISIMAVLGVVVLIAVMTLPVQEAEAGCERGGAPSTAFNASKGRCFRP